MGAGNLYIGMTTRETLNMNVQRLNDDIIHNLINVPVPSYSAENAYTFDTGSQNQFTINIKRRNPTDAYDPLDDEEFLVNITIGDGEDLEDAADRAMLNGDWSASYTWCNRLWKKGLIALVNRWQARTDGNRLTFEPVVTRNTPSGTVGIYQRKIKDVNVYLKTVSITYSKDSFEVIEASITMVRGSMCGQRIVGGTS